MKLRWAVYFNRFSYWDDYDERELVSEREREPVLEYFCDVTRMWRTVPIERICVSDTTK